MIVQKPGSIPAFFFVNLQEALVKVKKILFIFILFLASCLFPDVAKTQCSICTKTAQQLGEKPAKALNAGIIYLAFAPLAIAGYIGFRWYKSNR